MVKYLYGCPFEVVVCGKWRISCWGDAASSIFLGHLSTFLSHVLRLPLLELVPGYGKLLRFPHFPCPNGHKAAFLWDYQSDDPF